MSILWWLLEHWLLIAYAIAVIIGYTVGGWKVALGVATLGGGLLLYRQGHRDAENRYSERAEQIEQEREDAYNEIDNRGTTRNDVTDRLHKGNY